MKECPFCKAEIEEHARFCLYCMTSLEEKKVYENQEDKKKYIPIIVILLLIMVVITIIIIGCKENDNINDNTYQTTQSELNSDEQLTTSHTGSSTEPTDITDNSTKPPKNINSGSTSISTKPTTNNNEPTHNNTTKPTDDTLKEPNNTTNSSESEQPSPIPSGNNIYNYRDAVPADDYMANLSITKNAVVITSVKAISPDGTYVIPEEIDNKKVVAIMNNAFCDSNVSNTVKQVVIPASVKTINAYAFYKCYNLTDIYIKGEEVACPSVFIPEKDKRNYTLTIHCSSTCNDRNFRTYKTLCYYWDTVYKEWNG